MSIGKALKDNWNNEKQSDTEQSGMVSLEKYLEYNYQARYVELCQRCGIVPVSFGAWLRRSIETI